MGQDEAEELKHKLREAYQQIEWLEKEVHRLKMLLAGDDSMCNSLSYSKPKKDVET